MSDISVEQIGHIAVVTLDRPPINSLVRETYLELVQVFTQLGHREGARIAVLRANGRFFCPGNDVSEFEGLINPQDAAAYAELVSSAIGAIYHCELPVVAAVHGHAMGAGMAIAACADVIVAADDMQFGIPEIKVGVIGAAGFLALLVPEKVARYLSLSGGSISAQQVQQYGGVHSVVPADQVFDKSMAIATELCQRPPTALRFFKEAMNINQNPRLGEKYAKETEYSLRYVGSAEWKESVSAFMEKRPADYSEAIVGAGAMTED